MTWVLSVRRSTTKWWLKSIDVINFVTFMNISSSPQDNNNGSNKWNNNQCSNNNSDYHTITCFWNSLIHHFSALEHFLYKVIYKLCIIILIIIIWYVENSIHGFRFGWWWTLLLEWTIQQWGDQALLTMNVNS